MPFSRPAQMNSSKPMIKIVVIGSANMGKSFRIAKKSQKSIRGYENGS
jgi:signal recognition particle receptor subunit beta